jgi:hypothetical protein
VTTYQEPVKKALSSKVLSGFWKGYFRESFRASVNDQLIEIFDSFRAAGGTKKEIADKIDKRPEQVTRWLTSPSNLELDTISDLALAMGYMPRLQFDGIGQTFIRSNAHPSEVSYQIQWNPTGYMKTKPEVQTESPVQRIMANA